MEKESIKLVQAIDRAGGTTPQAAMEEAAKDGATKDEAA
jgi:hypothetical protein